VHDREEETVAGKRDTGYRKAFTGKLKVGDRVRDLNGKWYTDIDGRDPVTGTVGTVREVWTADKLYGSGSTTGTRTPGVRTSSGRPDQRAV
jgi:hypothetical protein